MASAETVDDRRSVLELIRTILFEASTIGHLEADLARAELTQHARATVRDIVLIVIAAGIALAAVLALTAALVLGLVSLDVAPWIAAAAVGLALAAVTAGIVLSRISALRRRPLLPRRTLASIERTASSLKEAMTSS